MSWGPAGNAGRSGSRWRKRREREETNRKILELYNHHFERHWTRISAREWRENEVGDRMAQLRPTGLAKKLSEQPVGTGEGRPATGRQHMPFSNCCEDFQNQPPRIRLAPMHQPVQIFKILRIVSKQYIHIFIYVYIIFKYILSISSAIFQYNHLENLPFSSE